MFYSTKSCPDSNDATGGPSLSCQGTFPQENFCLAPGGLPSLLTCRTHPPILPQRRPSPGKQLCLVSPVHLDNLRNKTLGVILLEPRSGSPGSWSPGWKAGEMVADAEPYPLPGPRTNTTLGSFPRHLPGLPDCSPRMNHGTWLCPDSVTGHSLSPSPPRQVSICWMLYSVKPCYFTSLPGSHLNSFLCSSLVAESLALHVLGSHIWALFCFVFLYF